MNDDDARLARWCAANDGILSVDDARRLGFAEPLLFRWAGRGVLVREHPGVYRHAAQPRTWRTRLRAALAAAGPGAYASGPSFARLHGIRGEWDEAPEVTIVGTRHLALRGVRVRRIDRLDDRRDVRCRDGVPCLAPELGLLLLGATAKPWKVRTAIHDMVFLGLTTRPRLVDVYRRYRARGRRGAVSFRRGVLTLGSGSGGATQTNLELDVLEGLVVAGAPRPELQLRVVDGDGRRRRLDLAWSDRHLDVEVDGDRYHLDAAAAAEMDRRDDALLRAGWHTERIGESEWALDRNGCVRRVLAALGLA